MKTTLLLPISLVLLISCPLLLQAQAAKPTMPTPPDLTNATVWVASFQGMPDVAMKADVIIMKAGSLRFRLYSVDYDYSGRYTVQLSKPRVHKKPLFGFGSPPIAKRVILAQVGRIKMWPIENPTIWEKSAGFINVATGESEWIHSGSYTIEQ
jgi:hypothetical protein